MGPPCIPIPKIPFPKIPDPLVLDIKLPSFSINFELCCLMPTPIPLTIAFPLPPLAIVGLLAPLQALETAIQNLLNQLPLECPFE